MVKIKGNDNFEALYRQHGQKRFGIRLLALWKIQSGMTEKATSLLLGKTQKTLHFWRKLYEAEGVEGLLKIREGRGRKAYLSDPTIISEEIQKLEKNKSGGRLTAEEIQSHFKSTHDINYSRSGVYSALHRLGFSWITSRSKHPKHDKEAIDTFKKTSPIE